MNIIDRRPNPTGKSHVNRERFIGRIREVAREAVAEAIKRRRISEPLSGDKISVQRKTTAEPVFRPGFKKNLEESNRSSKRDFILPGNKKYAVGDTIPRPPHAGGGGGGVASPEDNDEQDLFEFLLTREEFLELFFDDLELPDLMKKMLRESELTSLTRAGFSVDGSPSNRDLVRTMRNSLARRISLHRPRSEDIEALETQIQLSRLADDPEGELQGLYDLAALHERILGIPYVDPIDILYRRYKRVPKPNTQAVMFCLMDVSGSMTEMMKELAKRFFLLLRVFLERRYSRVQVVFIRHTAHAQEVDEQIFFYDRQTGGTVVSTALEEMLRVTAERYGSDWNLYVAQASDGDNYTEDNLPCQRCMDKILPIVQHFAYIEVKTERMLEFGVVSKTSLWRTYEELISRYPNFAMKSVSDPKDIFPVFHDLFVKKSARAG